jgi:hypothetical protein
MSLMNATRTKQGFELAEGKDMQLPVQYTSNVRELGVEACCTSVEEKV